KEKLLPDGLYDYAAGYQTYDWSFEAVREELKHNRSVILDSASLHSFILEAAQKIVSDIIPVQIRLKVLFLVVADRELRRERIQHRPPQTKGIRFDQSTINDYLSCYSHLPLPPGSFYFDTSTQQLENNMPRAIYYLPNFDEKYDDDEKKLKSDCKIHVLSKVR